MSASINIIPVVVLILFSVSCKKEITGDLPPQPGKPVYGAGDYQPANEGSTWVYSYKDTKGNQDLFTVKATKDTMSFDTLTYRVFVNYANSAGLNNYYIAVNSHNYYHRQNVTAGTNSPFPLNFLYLNDTYYDDDSWQMDAGKNDHYSAYIIGTIVAKDIDMNINNLQFPHVMHSRVVLYYEVNGVGSIKMATYDYYVAQNVGIVKIECQPSTHSGEVGFTQAIISYTLK